MAFVAGGSWSWLVVAAVGRTAGPPQAQQQLSPEYAAPDPTPKSLRWFDLYHNHDVLDARFFEPRHMLSGEIQTRAQPYFVDLNKDGRLDLITPNHYTNHTSFWDVALNCAEDGGSPCFKSVVPSTVIDWTDDADPADMHGAMISDVDQDGAPDLIINTGGNHGTAQAMIATDAMLLWGSTGDEEGHLLRFSGGRKLARESGLSGHDLSRGSATSGRYVFLADVNNDGLLDVLFGNQVTSDHGGPGNAHVNKGERTFEANTTFSEYAWTMTMHDVDGDGMATDLLVGRRECLGQPWLAKAGAPPGVYTSCAAKPCGTIGRFDTHSENGLIPVNNAWNKRMSFKDEAKCLESDVDDAFGTAYSMQSGDFDMDGKVDIALLKRNGIQFFYSADGNKVAPWDASETTPAVPSEIVRWDDAECGGQYLRTADFDLDGSLDVLVGCETPQAKLRLYTRSSATPAEGWQLVSASKVNLDQPLQEAWAAWESEHRDADTQSGQQNCYGPYEDRDKNCQTHLSALSLVDLNNDGFMDIITGQYRGHEAATKLPLGLVHFHLNAMGQEPSPHRRNQFLAIKLVGEKYALGATVKLTCGNLGSTGSETIVQLRQVSTVGAETDWGGAKDERIVFGLGRAGVPLRLEVFWPHSAKRSVLLQGQLQPHLNSMAEPLSVDESSAGYA
jgi:hypothetical protein